MQTVNLDLSNPSNTPPGQPDGLSETVTLTGRVLSDQLNITLGADHTSITVADTVDGVVATTHVTTLESSDHVVVSGGGGDDVLSNSECQPASPTSNSMAVTVPMRCSSPGVQGPTRFRGRRLRPKSAASRRSNSAAALVTTASPEAPENNSISGGTGADVLYWNVGDGQDTIDSGADADTGIISGTNGGDTIEVEGDGAAAFLIADGAAGPQFVNVETLNIKASGGSDTITMSDLVDAPIRTLNIDLTGAVRRAGRRRRYDKPDQSRPKSGRLDDLQRERVAYRADVG